MEENKIEADNLCSVCRAEPVWLDGMCQYCYEENIESGWQDNEKEIIPKHGQGLKDTPNIHKERMIKKSVKIQRRK